MKNNFNPFRHLLANVRTFGVRYLIFNIPYQLLKLIKQKNKISRNNQDVIRKVNGYKMMLNSSKKGIHSDLLEAGIREPLATKIVEKKTKPGEVVLEVGANIGYYTIMQSKIIGKSGRIYAIEPISDNLNYLRRNINLNNLKNVEVHPIALREKNKKLEIFTFEEANLNSAIKWSDRNLGSETVVGMTMDSFLKGKRSPNWIRMDVEGYEWNILMGAKKSLKNKNLKNLFIEVHFDLLPRKKIEAIFKLLKENNFKIKYAVVEDKSISECRGPLKGLKKFFYTMRKKYRVFKNISIDDILKNDDILDGHIGAMEIFFVR